jgi:hypothetical protein
MNHWKSNDNLVEWSNDSLSLSFDRTDPGDGLSLRAPVLGTAPAARLFGVRLPWGEKPALAPSQQVGCSGSSLRVTFAETRSFPVETSVAWHVIEVRSGRPEIDAVVSVGTQMLDACPQLELISRFKGADSLNPKGLVYEPAGERTDTGAAGSGGTCTLFRWPHVDFTYVEMVHPSDFHSCDISHDRETGWATLRHSLFSSSLEKGVILRARLRGAFLPRDDDEVAAASCFARFLAAAPPLGH